MLIYCEENVVKISQRSQKCYSAIHWILEERIPKRVSRIQRLHFKNHQCLSGCWERRVTKEKRKITIIPGQSHVSWLVNKVTAPARGRGENDDPQVWHWIFSYSYFITFLVLLFTKCNKCDSSLNPVIHTNTEYGIINTSSDYGIIDASDK